MKRTYKFERPEVGECLSINDRAVDSSKDSNEAKAKITAQATSEANPGESKNEETVKHEAEETTYKKIRLEGLPNETCDDEGLRAKSEEERNPVCTAKTSETSPSQHHNSRRRKAKDRKRRKKQNDHKDNKTMEFGDKEGCVMAKKDDVIPDRCSGDGDRGDMDDEEEQKSKGSSSTVLQNKSFVGLAEASTETQEAEQLQPRFEGDLSMVSVLEENHEESCQDVFEDPNDVPERMNSVVVYGIPDEHFITDALLCVLEHRRQGGGEVQEYKYDASRRMVVVTFKNDKGFCERVLDFVLSVTRS